MFFTINLYITLFFIFLKYMSIYNIFIIFIYYLYVGTLINIYSKSYISNNKNKKNIILIYSLEKLLY